MNRWLCRLFGHEFWLEATLGSWLTPGLEEFQPNCVRCKIPNSDFEWYGVYRNSKTKELVKGRCALYK